MFVSLASCRFVILTKYTVNAQKRKVQNSIELAAVSSPGLELRGHVISATTGELIERCFGCIQREKKMFEKKMNGSAHFHLFCTSTHFSCCFIVISFVDMSQAMPTLDQERFRTLQVY